MMIELSPDLEAIRETTARFLDNHMPVDRVRALREDPAGFDPKFWARGVELGWAGLLVSEENGGGTVSGSPVTDLSVIAHEFGVHAAPGPLVPVNVVSSALDRGGSQEHLEVLDGLLSGTTIATWCLAEPPPHDGLGDVRLDIRREGDDVIVTGVKRPVEHAGEADYLLVSGRTGDGLTQVLVPSGTKGVTVRPLRSLDLTRRFSMVSFEDVRLPVSAVVGELGRADAQVEWQLQTAIVLHNAESIGAMRRGFDMTVAWSFDRYSFGRPLASYQELKHRFADMLSWLEASNAINDAAATAVDTGDPRAGELVSAAKAFIGDNGTELLQDCVQIHGGIGVTFEHDLHLFLRRVTLDCALYGTPAEHRKRIADLLIARTTA